MKYVTVYFALKCSWIFIVVMDVHVLKNLLKEVTWFKPYVEVCVLFLMLLFPL